MATHSSSYLNNLLNEGAWQATIHGVGESRMRLSDFTFTFHFHALEKEITTHSSVLAWRIRRTGSLVGCCLWGCTELDTTEATQQQQQQHYSIFLYLSSFFYLLTKQKLQFCNCGSIINYIYIVYKTLKIFCNIYLFN